MAALTAAQRRGLMDIASVGYVRTKGTLPQQGAAASRMTGRLREMGLIELVPGARWKLTPEGEVAVGRAPERVLECCCYRDCGDDTASGTWHQHENDPCPVHPDAPMVG